MVSLRFPGKVLQLRSYAASFQVDVEITGIRQFNLDASPRGAKMNILLKPGHLNRDPAPTGSGRQPDCYITQLDTSSGCTKVHFSLQYLITDRSIAGSALHN